jgi:hypothetical protein
MGFGSSFQKSFEVDFRLSFEVGDATSHAMSFEASNVWSDVTSLELSDGRSDEVSCRTGLSGNFEMSSQRTFEESFARSFDGILLRPVQCGQTAWMTRGRPSLVTCWTGYSTTTP